VFEILSYWSYTYTSSYFSIKTCKTWSFCGGKAAVLLSYSICWDFADDWEFSFVCLSRGSRSPAVYCKLIVDLF
jgi:hypothetical protein